MLWRDRQQESGVTTTAEGKPSVFVLISNVFLPKERLET